MSFKNTYNFILQHPLTKNRKFPAFVRLIKWQFKSRLLKGPFIHPFVNDSVLLIKKGMTGATGNIYSGLHEFYDMAFLLHFLKKDDLFIDVGANVGTYTVLAASCKGARTICFEPIPETYQNLIENISVNKIQNLVNAYEIALGKSKGNLNFTTNHDTMNHVVENENSKNDINVKTSTLDISLIGLSPILIKIDVEGYETEVINGGNITLKSDSLKAIIIELNGSGKRYGFNENDIHEYLFSLGFYPYLYEPFSRQLTLQTNFGTHNTIYLRDIPFIEERLKNAESFSVLKYQI